MISLKQPLEMKVTYFQTTNDLSDPSPFILKHSKVPNSILADTLFRKKLYETPKKDIPNLLRYHYKRCDEPTEFADHVIELLEVALDENEDVKFLKSLSFKFNHYQAGRPQNIDLPMAGRTPTFSF